MNIFRLLGDLCHLLAIVILLLKIWKSRSCAGTKLTNKLNRNSRRYKNNQICHPLQVYLVNPNFCLPWFTPPGTWIC